jgi:hypothetical protein
MRSAVCFQRSRSPFWARYRHCGDSAQFVWCREKQPQACMTPGGTPGHENRSNRGSLAGLRDDTGGWIKNFQGRSFVAPLLRMTACEIGLFVFTVWLSWLSGLFRLFQHQQLTFFNGRESRVLTQRQSLRRCRRIQQRSWQQGSSRGAPCSAVPPGLAPPGSLLPTLKRGASFHCASRRGQCDDIEVGPLGTEQSLGRPDWRNPTSANTAQMWGTRPGR